MTSSTKNSLILIVTLKVAYLQKGISKAASELKARAGELAEILVSLINALFEKGADVHVALPDYRRVFNHK